MSVAHTVRDALEGFLHISVPSWIPSISEICVFSHFDSVTYFPDNQSRIKVRHFFPATSRPVLESATENSALLRISLPKATEPFGEFETTERNRDFFPFYSCVLNSVPSEVSPTKQAKNQFRTDKSHCPIAKWASERKLLSLTLSPFLRTHHIPTMSEF